jgi:uncharacterized protein
MRSKYDKALKLASKSSRKTREVYDMLVAADAEGDPRATYAIATWYLHGSRFTRKNIKYANELLEKAALQNVPEAAYDFAISLEKGAGIRKSAVRAFEFYMRAALLGDKQSVFEIGRMYNHGIGTRKNRRLAEIWYDRAAQLGILD